MPLDSIPSAAVVAFLESVGLPADTKELDPDAATATMLELLRGNLQKLVDIHTAVDGLEGFTDGLETLIGTTNTALTALQGFVDGLEAKDYATQTTLAAVLTSLQLLDNAIAGNEIQVDVLTMPAVTVGGAKFVTKTVTKARPANTTTYTVNTAWADSTTAPTALTFSDVVDATGKSGRIVGLVVNSSANPTLALQAELFLYDTAVTTPNDNAAFALSDAEADTRVAKIPFALDTTNNPAAGAAGNIGTTISNLNDTFTTVGSTNLHGLIKVLNAYIPVTGEILTFRLKVEQID